MAEEFDLAVIGAGPAGAEAALAASAHGLSVLLLDDAEYVGGQVFRAPPPAFREGKPAKPGSDAASGGELRARLASSDVTHATSRRVWLATSDFDLHTAGTHGSEIWSASAICVAAGTHERIYPFPGWTKPGIIGLAAATILLKSQFVLPGRRPVVAGSGPLLLAVASAIIEAGGEVAALVDANAPLDWLRTLPGSFTRPDLLRRGSGWLRTIRNASVPIYRRSAVAAAHGVNTLERVEIVPLASGKYDAASTTIETDALCVGFGLIPAIEALRLLGAAVTYEADLGGWVPTIDDFGRTSVPKLYATGDCAGIRGAAAASAAGTIAGLCAAHDLNALSEADFQSALHGQLKALRKAARFGRGMARLMAPRPELISLAQPDTIVCRCEEVSRNEIETALTAGAHDVNQLKSWTRCGMGACQGRFCGEAAATLVASRVGSREKAGIWTARIPLQPVSINDLVGSFAYDDIPKPAPAPA